MKVDFQIGTVHKASYFTAKFMYVGRWNDDCNRLCLVFVNAMQKTFQQAAKEAEITDEQMQKAKEQAASSPIHVWLEVSPVKNTFPCRVSFDPRVNAPADVLPKQMKMAYNFADVLCEYVKDYGRQARNGEAPKKFRNMFLERNIQR